MPSTNYGDVEHVGENQNQKTVTINTAFDEITSYLMGLYTEDLAGDSGNITPDADALKVAVVKTTGAMSGAVNLILPDRYQKYWVIHDATGHDLTVKTASGSGVTISPTEAQLMYCDSVNVIAIGASGGSGAAKPTAPSKERLTGAGGLTDVSIGANVDPNVTDVYIAGAKLDKGTEFNIIESVPASGDYDTLDPLISDIFPSGATIVVEYYSP